MNGTFGPKSFNFPFFFGVLAHGQLMLFATSLMHVTTIRCRTQLWQLPIRKKHQTWYCTGGTAPAGGAWPIKLVQQAAKPSHMASSVHISLHEPWFSHRGGHHQSWETLERNCIFLKNVVCSVCTTECILHLHWVHEVARGWRSSKEMPRLRPWFARVFAGFLEASHWCPCKCPRKIG